MAKLSRREYRNKAKRPGARGFGFSSKGRSKAVEVDAAAVAEASADDGDGIPEPVGIRPPVPVDPDRGTTMEVEPADSGIQIPGDYDDGVSDVDESALPRIELVPIDLNDQAEENLTDLAEQEKELENEDIADKEIDPNKLGAIGAEASPAGYRSIDQ